MRHALNFYLKKIKKFKLKALYSLNISFYGFSAEETQHMKDVTVENGTFIIQDLSLEIKLKIQPKTSA